MAKADETQKKLNTLKKVQKKKLYRSELLVVLLVPSVYPRPPKKDTPQINEKPRERGITGQLLVTAAGRNER